MSQCSRFFALLLKELRTPFLLEQPTLAWIGEVENWARWRDGKELSVVKGFGVGSFVEVSWMVWEVVQRLADRQEAV